MQKLYCYVDESGQDTQGALFVVGIVVTDRERDVLFFELEKIERESGKKNLKWHKARPQFRVLYIERILRSNFFERSLFYDVFEGSREYLRMTSLATAKAILSKAAGETYRATVYVDGLHRKDIMDFSAELQSLHIQKRKVRGVRRDENDACIRLADALCGLIRDAKDGNTWAQTMLHALQKKKAVIAL